jgi:hypothetical protein
MTIRAWAHMGGRALCFRRGSRGLHDAADVLGAAPSQTTQVYDVFESSRAGAETAIPAADLAQKSRAAVPG